jgi:hypothetical protein
MPIVAGVKYHNHGSFGVSNARQAAIGGAGWPAGAETVRGSTRADDVDFIQMSKSRGAANGWPATSGGDDKCPFMGLGSILKI